MKQRFSTGDKVIVSIFLPEENRYQEYFATVVAYNEFGFPNKRRLLKRYKVRIDSTDLYNGVLTDVGECRLKRR